MMIAWVGVQYAELWKDKTELDKSEMTRVGEIEGECLSGHGAV